MPIVAIYANIACRDLGTSIAWYETLFARVPDANPMPGLAEWHHGTDAGLQLYEDAGKVGRGTLTLTVTGLSAERARLAALGPGPIEPITQGVIVRMTDPDGNLVVLVEP